jgi:hypothetical protein
MADIVRSELRVEISDALVGRTRIEQNDIDHVTIHLAFAHHAHRRNADTFLVDALANRRLGTGNHTADIGVVRDIGDECNDFVADVRPVR